MPVQLGPIQEQLQSLKTELGQLRSLPTDVTRLSATLFDHGDLPNAVKSLSLAVDEIRAQFGTLTADVKHLRDLITTSARTTGLPSPLGSAFQSSSKRTSGTG
jgi:hypothetical protein